jgi:predicted lipid-binding transport protein (Tim44 family)
MQEMGMFRNRLTPGLYASLQARCDELRSARQSWHVDKIDVEHAEVAQAWTQDGHDYAEVRLVGSLCEYTADDAGGAIVAGSNQAPRSFDERWTFMRPSGSTPWRLAAIQAA